MTGRNVFFDRPELDRILRFYGRMVAAGEWRDYAIEHRPDKAAFAVFRRAYDQPLFVVTKYPPGSDRKGNYAVSAGTRKLSHGWSIDDVLRVLNRKLLRLAT